MQAVIPVGVEYAQLLEDVRAVVRHELTNRATATATEATPVDELLTVREAAALLDVTQQTVHEWKRRGLLKYHKLGQRTYLKRADVLSALQGHQRTTKKGR
ncbi:helix-turn-helix domain-containing protein [Hymenobacter rubripertinctus]|nr:helix-turn-helix domain-containing protein [Hymenobacter rubripertinctus]